MRYSAILIVLAIFLTGCSSESDYVDIEEERTVLTDVLTLELSFGADEEKLEDEFLLAGPIILFCVSDAGDVIVCDEYRLKVFDDNGNGKTIIGGMGQGPGEFQYPPFSPTVSHTGYLTVNAFTGINVYYLKTVDSREYVFKEKLNLNRTPLYVKLAEEKLENELVSTQIEKVYQINEDQRIVNFSIRGEQRTRDTYEPPKFDIIVFEKPDTLIELVNYVSNPVRIFGGLYGWKPFYGEFDWDILDDSRVVFTHSAIDVKSDANNPKYFLHITSFETFESFKITQSYLPVEIPDSTKNEYYNKYYSEDTEHDRYLKNYVKEKKYFPPLQDLITDRHFIFVFTYQQNNEGEILVDVFDANSGEFMHSAYFPILPLVIKDGYAYRRTKNEEGFDVVEKYKINPSVYGK